MSNIFKKDTKTGKYILDSSSIQKEGQIQLSVKDIDVDEINDFQILRSIYS